MMGWEHGVESPVGRARQPLLRTATVLPYVLVVAHAVTSAEELPLGAILPYLAVAALLAGAGIAVGTERWLARFGRRSADRWALLSVFVGTALLAPVLGQVLAVNVPAFGAVIGLMLLNMAVMLGPRIRYLAGGWVVVVWVVTLWWSGQRDPVVLLGAAAAATAVFGAGVVAADQLLRAAAREAEARLQADGSARLLESLLGSRSLDVEGVARAAAEAVHYRGYRGAAVRLFDPQRREARCLAAAGDVDTAPLRVADSSALSLALTDGLATTQTDADGEVERFHPLREGPETVAVLQVRGRTPQGDDDGRPAVVAIARRAEGALARARGFERDRYDTRELAWLEQRTNDLVSTVSHELRTPMTVIGGLGETLRDRWPHLPPEVRATLVRRIGANADRLDAIIGSLIDSGSLEHGQLRPEPREIRLHDLVAGVVDRLALLTAAHRVHTEIPADLRVTVDPALLEHVIENLLVNVAHHTPPGTQAVVAAQPGSQGGVLLTVVDDGPGIPTADLAHVFERFFRGGDPDRRSSGGLGLGLPLARQIVRAHGGELTVARAAAEGGTRFTLWLPEQRPGPARTAGELASAPRPRPERPVEAEGPTAEGSPAGEPPAGEPPAGGHRHRRPPDDR